jgi:KUP system potassium uptake protein
VFLTSSTEGAPLALLHYLRHHLVPHEKLVILSIQTKHVPEVAAEARIESAVHLGLGVYQVTAAYGFMQAPNVLDVIDACREKGVEIERRDTTFYLGRETLVMTDARGMARWRKALFAYMSRNRRPANAFFQIPSSRVVELGTHIEL